MTNHVQLLASPREPDSIPRTLQSLGRRYVRYVNAAYRRTGTLCRGTQGRRDLDGRWVRHQSHVPRANAVATHGAAEFAYKRFSA
jgi:hypothetical protein